MLVEINDRKEFEERADFIDNDDLLQWTVENEHFREIQKRLLAKGAKLLAGPRGSGKTHHMKVAYNRYLRTPKDTLAIYVSFGKYYHLEPFLYKSPSAFKIFHTWILGKILLGCQQLITDLNDTWGKGYAEINILNEFLNLENFISQTEKGIANEEHGELIARLTIHEVEKTLETLANGLNRKKIVLFLDDAALTLTPDYMREFFDVFRSLKSSRISPKASVYPGTTEYGPRFHVGHDAVKVDCWPNVEDIGCSKFMDQFIEKRFPDILKSIPKDIIDLLKYAAFGIPRAFINLIRDFEETKKNKRSQEVFNTVIDEQAALIKAEYLSLSQKMPQYKTIIRTGDDLFEKMTDILTEENRRYQKEGKEKKQIIIGIQQKQELTMNINISRMIKFLIEAGLLYPLPPVKHGSSKKREYERYIPHLLFLIKKRAFSSDRGFNAGQIVEYIRRESAKHPKRKTVNNLLDKNQIENIKLDLPPCSHCGTLRLSEDQKFCHHCGHQLVEKSRFEECMKISVNDLPLPGWQKERLKKQTSLKTIEDIISLSDPGSELQKIKQVGPIRSEKIVKIIKKYTERFVEEFLG
jgi:hypothetical protein